MIGIIFAAGIGSRLKPFTDFHPKALAEIGGRPMLVRVAEKLLNAGARKLIVNIHHFPEQVRECIASQPFSGKVEFSDESERLLDTGGALVKIARESAAIADAAPEEPIVVHNADIYTDFQLSNMITAHIGSIADATILCDTQRYSSRHFLFNEEGILCGWENTASNIIRPDNLSREGLITAAFGGVHILSHKTLKQIGNYAHNKIEPFSITDWYINNCSTLIIKSYQPSQPYNWFDIGTTEKLKIANDNF